MRRGESHHIKTADEVDADDFGERLQRQRPLAAHHAPGIGDAGAVDQHLRHADGFDRLGHGPLGGFRIGHIADHRAGVAADFRRLLFQRIGVGVQKRNPRPAPGQISPGRRPHAGSAAGDDRG